MEMKQHGEDAANSKVETENAVKERNEKVITK